MSTRTEESGEARPTFARRDELDEDHEEDTWEEFFETFEARDWVFVYHETDHEDDYPIQAARIAEVTDDEVVLCGGESRRKG